MEEFESGSWARDVDVVEKTGDNVVVETKTLKLPIIANNITNVFVEIVKFLRSLGHILVRDILFEFRH